VAATAVFDLDRVLLAGDVDVVGSSGALCRRRHRRPESVSWR
jgi:hypothetical protein